jgi:hypothetical protein
LYLTADFREPSLPGSQNAEKLPLSNPIHAVVLHDRAIPYRNSYTLFEASSVPDNPSYIHKLEGILEEARAPKPISFFRRRDIEALFGLKKRQAVNLMHRIGAVRVSRELAVDQRDLIRWLERMIANPSVAAEWHRHERVIGRIVELKAETAARAVKIVFPDQKPSVLLPDGVSLEPGLLTVVFEDDQQLLQRLFLLARVLADEPEMLTRMNQPPVN